MEETLKLFVLKGSFSLIMFRQHSCLLVLYMCGSGVREVVAFMISYDHECSLVEISR
jgi:hypothetical protein